MSYDISVGPILTPEYKEFNITYNLSHFFQVFINKSVLAFESTTKESTTGLRALHNLKGKEVKLVLERAFTELENYILQCPRDESVSDYLSRQFNPANKWGDVVMAILLLKDLLILSVQHPDVVFEVN